MPRDGRRVLVLCNHFTEGNGGTPESVLLLARQLDCLGIACDVSCDRGLCRDVGVRHQLPRAGEDNVFEPSIPPPAGYGALFVAGSWNLRSPAMVLRARLAGLPVVYAAKGCLSRIEFTRLRDMRRIPYLLLVEWWLLAAARHIVFTSSIEREACVVPHLLWGRKAVVVPEPFEGSAAVAPAARDGATIGFLAEISPRKGLLELIDGFGVFLAKHPDSALRLKIAGMPRAGTQAYMETCKARSIRNGSAHRIEWLGAVRGAARDVFYSGLDLFVCPSRFESFGLTVLEALWQGTPVCSGRCLGVLEFLRREAPVAMMSSLRDADVAQSLAGFLAVQPAAGAWRGQQAGMQSNRSIAQAFARLFFGEADKG
jgi:glycosyltransferase involved in cell wall biosynthesis